MITAIIALNLTDLMLTEPAVFIVCNPGYVEIIVKESVSFVVVLFRVQVVAIFFV